MVFRPYNEKPRIRVGGTGSSRWVATFAGCGGFGSTPRQAYSRLNVELTRQCIRLQQSYAFAEGIGGA